MQLVEHDNIQTKAHSLLVEKISSLVIPVISWVLQDFSEVTHKNKKMIIFRGSVTYCPSHGHLTQNFHHS